VQNKKPTTTTVMNIRKGYSLMAKKRTHEAGKPNKNDDK
jgi:hypothetical protein